MAVCLCSGSSHRKQELVKELQRNAVPFDVRKLNVGDFLWVAREKVSPLPGSKQFLLSMAHFLHRSAENRFSCSVSRSAPGTRRQGACPRLHHREEADRRPVRQHHRRSLQGTEGRRVSYLFRLPTNIGALICVNYSGVQFRLKRCGLRKPIYLVELHGNAASHLSLPETTLQQAIVNTQVRLPRSPFKGAARSF